MHSQAGDLQDKLLGCLATPLRVSEVVDKLQGQATAEEIYAEIRHATERQTLRFNLQMRLERVSNPTNPG